MRLDRHKDKGGCLLMQIKDMFPFDDKMVTLPQSADPHLEQQGISITIPNRQQLHIHHIPISPRSSCSAGHNASTVHLPSNNEMSLIVGDIIAHHSKLDTNANEDERDEQLADEIDTAECTLPNESEATRLPTNGRSISPDISLASNNTALLSDCPVSASLAGDHLPILITINSELSMIDGPLQAFINFKKTDWACNAETCNKYLAEAGETRTVEHAEMIFRKAVYKASGLFIPAAIDTFNQPLRHQPNRWPMNETESDD